MPVRLNTIPDAEPYPKPLAKVKWLAALLLLLSTGVALTSLFASDDLAKNGPYFWGLACGVPAFIWSLAASVRWLVFMTLHIRASAWNERREDVILQETRRGRRALQILGLSIQTALNGDSLTETTADFLARKQALSTYSVLRGENTVRRSVIPVLTDQSVISRLSEILSRLFNDISPQLTNFIGELHINVLIETNIPIPTRVMGQVLEKEWQKTELPDARLLSSPETGLAAVDDWLDNYIQEKGVLLVISVRLEPENPELTAESACALLLANRLYPYLTTPLALLHRPERVASVKSMAVDLAQALYWVPVSPDAITGTWAAELSTVQRRALLSLNQPFCHESSSLYQLDAFLGCSGPAAPWLSIAAATLAAIHLQQPQLALSGVPYRDTLWAAVVSPYVLPQEAS